MALLSLPSGPKLHVEHTSPPPSVVSALPPILFIHGLGGSSANIGPVIEASGLAATRRIIAFDLEGHGLSPLSGGEISIVNYAESAREVLDAHRIDKAIVIAHSMGGLLAILSVSPNLALTTVYLTSPVLLGPIKQLGEPGVKGLTARAETVRKGGMIAIADTVSKAGMSERTLATSLLARHFARASLLSSPAEGYALACLAATRATDPDYGKIEANTLILAGEEDKTSPEPVVLYLKEQIPKAEVITLKDVGHWHLVEDIQGVAKAIKAFID